MVLRQATYWHRSKAKIQNRTGIQQPGRRQGWRNHKLQWCSGQLLWNHSGDKTGASQKQNYPLRAKTLVPAGQSGNFRPDPALVESFFRKSKRREDIFANQTGRDSADWIAKERLNLLYTIFMNNGVDFSKVDTVFSLTEPNAFIIRTLQLKQNLP